MSLRKNAFGDREAWHTSNRLLLGFYRGNGATMVAVGAFGRTLFVSKHRPYRFPRISVVKWGEA